MLTKRSTGQGIGPTCKRATRHTSEVSLRARIKAVRPANPEAGLMIDLPGHRQDVLPAVPAEVHRRIDLPGQPGIEVAPGVLGRQQGFDALLQVQQSEESFERIIGEF